MPSTLLSFITLGISCLHSQPNSLSTLCCITLGIGRCQRQTKLPPALLHFITLGISGCQWQSELLPTLLPRLLCCSTQLVSRIKRQPKMLTTFLVRLDMHTHLFERNQSTW